MAVELKFHQVSLLSWVGVSSETNTNVIQYLGCYNVAVLDLWNYSNKLGHCKSSCTQNVLTS